MNTGKIEGAPRKKQTKGKRENLVLKGYSRLEAIDVKGHIIKPVIIMKEFTGKAAPKSAQELIDRIKKGLPTATIYELSLAMDISPARLLSVLDIAQRTVDRRKKEGKLNRNESERLYRVGHLFKRAITVLGSEEAARNWLKTPKKALGDQVPLDYADTEIGAREVDDLLGRIEHGVFS